MPLPLLLTVLWAGSLAGQAPAPWRRSIYPTGISLSGNTGPQVGVGFAIARPADSLARHLLDGSVVAAGGYGLRGSWFGSVWFRAPGLWPGWRVVASGLAQREVRFEFVGLGNESTYDPDLVSDSQPYFYKLRRTRYRGTLEVTRGLGGSRLIALAVAVTRTQFDSLPGPSRFLSDFGPRVIEVDRTARLSLVFDHRNNEYDPDRGLFAELSATVGSGGSGYTRFTGAVRGYIPIGAQTVVALRVVAGRTAGGPPLSARFELPMWEGSIDPLGGPTSHRGLRSQRFIGRDVEFGNVELRRWLFRLGAHLEILGAGFVDVGRVFENEPFVLTTQQLKFGPGLGLGVRRNGRPLVNVSVTKGPDGVVVTSRTGWAF
ncbi:MAG TPA: BamA/TamA family outer membrane protein [Gemmatimonadales bacterium]|nr:BamA/TamA family outer membrane protein [Gemmatimonadales bacterium]